MLHTKINALGLLVSGEYFFYVFTIQVNVNHVTTRVGPFLATEPLSNKLRKVPLGDATYQISRLSALLSRRLALSFQTRKFIYIFSK